MKEDFPPETLREYALLADGERGAVLGPRGDVAFLCAPRWHDPALFSSLVGGRGHYAVTPATPRFVWGGYYEAGTLIWRSRWVTTDSVVEIREALAFPGDPHRLVLLRRVEAVHGAARVRTVLEPRADFGRDRLVARPAGSAVLEGRCGPLHLRWTGHPRDVRAENGSFTGSLEIAEGDHHDLVLEVSDLTLPQVPDARAVWRDTEAAWRSGRAVLRDSIAPGDVGHSVAVLRGLTSSSDGMVAAATTSLPERAESGRNYDYRYAWIRDQCYAGQAAAAAGADGLLQSSADFVAARLVEDGPELKPAYTVDGGRVPDESRLDLPGYPGGSDVVGNHVNHQFQLDSPGEALLLLTATVHAGQEREHHHAAARTAAHVIAERWRRPEAGIWELDDRQWTHSRLVCTAGLRAYAHARPGPDTADWDRLADAILAETNRTALHPSGRWQRATDDDRVDAALLIPALRGAVPATDPRTVATVDAVRDELAHDGYVYRFRHDDRPLHEAEGAFLLCGFHLALADHQLGRQVDAVRWFERNRCAVGPPGLLTEEFDVVQRQLRGNLPQAFVHAVLVETATRLAEPLRPAEQEHA